MLFLWICLGLLAWLVLPLPIALAVGRFMSGDSKAAVANETTLPVGRVDTAQVA